MLNKTLAHQTAAEQGRLGRPAKCAMAISPRQSMTSRLNTWDRPGPSTWRAAETIPGPGPCTPITWKSVGRPGILQPLRLSDLQAFIWWDFRPHFGHWEQFSQIGRWSWLLGRTLVIPKLAGLH